MSINYIQNIKTNQAGDTESGRSMIAGGAFFAVAISHTGANEEHDE